VRFQASSAVELRPSFFWDVTLRRLVVGYRRSGQFIELLSINCPKRRYPSTNLRSLTPKESRPQDIFALPEAFREIFTEVRKVLITHCKCK